MRDQTVHEDRVYQGVRFDVYRVGFPRAASEAAGVAEVREVVVPNDAVVILPLLDPETVVMIRNRRPALGQTLWELPAGTREPGEDPDACAAREVQEETGYRAGRLTRLIDFFTAPGFCTENLTAYRAEELEPVGQSLDETEQIQVETMPLTEALGMIRDGRVRDAKTVAALLYHWTFGRAGNDGLG